MSCFQAKNIITELADLLLPEPCALCGASLTLSRSPIKSIPLCSKCLKIADKSLISRQANLCSCSRCGYPLTSEAAECLPCRDRNWNFISCASFFLYREVGRDLICAYKFENRRGLAGYFAGLVLEHHNIHHPEAVIVPVPFRVSSKKKRGWDQIEEITHILKKISNIRVSACLKREKGPAQKIMSFQQRLLNLDGKIHLKNGYEAPKTVLLLDDVFTTGATMDYCAGILKKAGAADIFALSIAIDL